MQWVGEGGGWERRLKIANTRTAKKRRIMRKNAHRMMRIMFVLRDDSVVTSVRAPPYSSNRSEGLYGVFCC